MYSNINHTPRTISRLYYRHCSSNDRKPLIIPIYSWGVGEVITEIPEIIHFWSQFNLCSRLYIFLTGVRRILKDTGKGKVPADLINGIVRIIGILCRDIWLSILMDIASGECYNWVLTGILNTSRTIAEAITSNMFEIVGAFLKVVDSEVQDIFVRMFGTFV